MACEQTARRLLLHLALLLALCKGSNFWRNKKAETRVRRWEWLTKRAPVNAFISGLINLFAHLLANPATC